MDAVRIPVVDESPMGHELADAEVMLSGGDLTAVMRMDQLPQPVKMQK